MVRFSFIEARKLVFCNLLDEIYPYVNVGHLSLLEHFRSNKFVQTLLLSMYIDNNNDLVDGNYDLCLVSDYILGNISLVYISI